MTNEYVGNDEIILAQLYLGRVEAKSLLDLLQVRGAEGRAVDAAGSFLGAAGKHKRVNCLN